MGQLARKRRNITDWDRRFEVSQPITGTVIHARDDMKSVIGSRTDVRGDELPSLLRDARFTEVEHTGKKALFFGNGGALAIPKDTLSSNQRIATVALLMLVRPAKPRPQMKIVDAEAQAHMQEEVNVSAVEEAAQMPSAQKRHKPRYKNRNPRLSSRF